MPLCRRHRFRWIAALLNSRPHRFRGGWPNSGIFSFVSSRGIFILFCGHPIKSGKQMPKRKSHDIRAEPGRGERRRARQAARPTSSASTARFRRALSDLERSGCARSPDSRSSIPARSRSDRIAVIGAACRRAALRADPLRQGVRLRGLLRPAAHLPAAPAREPAELIPSASPPCARSCTAPERPHGPAGHPDPLRPGANIAALQHLCEETEGEQPLDRARKLRDPAQGRDRLPGGAARSLPARAVSLYYALGKITAGAPTLGPTLPDRRHGPGAAPAGGGDRATPLVAITYRRLLHAARGGDFVAFAAQRKVPVVGITDQPLSPLTAQCDVVFYVEDARGARFRSLGASMCLRSRWWWRWGRRGRTRQSARIPLFRHELGAAIPRVSKIALLQANSWIPRPALG